MTDREMLELAAKAAGISGTWSKGYQPHGDMEFDGIETGCQFLWNPLVSDGDALRLASALKIDLDWQSTKQFTEDTVEEYRSARPGHFCATEPEADYRRAITRVAAHIGKAMQETTS